MTMSMLTVSVGVHGQPVPKSQVSRDIGTDAPFLTASPGSHIPSPPFRGRAADDWHENRHAIACLDYRSKLTKLICD